MHHLRARTAAVLAGLLIASAPVRAQSPAPRLNQLAGQLGEGRVVLRDIHFAPGSDRIDPSSDSVLRDLAGALVASAGVFLVEGHTDLMRDSEFAQHLSEQRAAAVKARLVSEGVAANRLLAVGYGASRPARTDHRHNARIEVTRVQ
jgi:outer membrane protein OmpA-like peptidoglycan-associated protein